MFERGFWQVARWRGVPLRIHWTAPLGAILFGGLQLAPVFWVGFLVLVTAHELGHALLVLRYGHRVESIDVTGFGGVTRWSGYATGEQRAIVAWGGVVAQAALLLAALVVLFVAGPPTTIVGAQLESVFVRTNLWLIVLNLLPFRPFDGATAWPLLRTLASRIRDRVARAASAARTRPPRGPDGGGSAAQRSSASSDEARRVAELLRGISRDAGQARRRG